MNNYHPTYDFGGLEDMLSGAMPSMPLYEGPLPWFIPSSGPGGDDPLFCGTPPGPGGGPVIMPSVDTPPGPNDPLDCW